MTWTSRERVVAALEHREPDRVPVDINPVPDFYLALKDYLGLDVDGEAQIASGSMEEAIPHPRVLQALGADLISVKPVPPRRGRQAPPAGDTVVDAWGVGLRRVYQPAGGSYLEPVHHPLAHATLDDLDTYPWPNVSDPDWAETTQAHARRLYEDTDLALVGRFGGPIVQTAIYLMGFERWLVCTAQDPEFAGRLLDKITDVAMALDRAGLEATAPYLHVFKVSGDDFGMQTGLLYSPRTFRRLFLPRLRRRWLAARAYLDQVNPAVRLMFHSCGGIRPIIPDLVDIGLQVLDPVQPLAAGMDSAGLKRDFGEHLTFHGGVDEQRVLPFGTVADVEAEVRRRIRDYAPGGGYILAPSHYVQAGTPPANVLAMCRAAQHHGCYPLDF